MSTLQLKMENLRGRCAKPRPCELKRLTKATLSRDGKTSTQYIRHALRQGLAVAWDGFAASFHVSLQAARVA